jgi:hypothetical protein
MVRNSARARQAWRARYRMSAVSDSIPEWL